MCWVSWGLEMWGPNVDLSPSSCCPPSNGWVSAPGFSTPSTLTTRETRLLSTSPLRFTFYPSITLPYHLNAPGPIRQFCETERLRWCQELPQIGCVLEGSGWCVKLFDLLHCMLSEGGPGFLRENGRGSCKGVENLQKAGKLSSLLLVPAPHFTWKSIIMQWFWLCRRGVCTR